MTIMRAEIGEIPLVVGRLLRDGAAATAVVADAIQRASPRWVSIVARGTSDNAAVFARFLIETQLGLPVGLASPSVTTIYRAPIDWHDGLVIAISQSGQSPDIVAVTEVARSGGATTVAITNDPNSPVAAAAEHGIDCGAGQERAVAATKTYVAQLAAVAALVGKLAPGPTLRAALPALPDELTAALDQATAWVDGPAGQELAGAMATAGRAIIASRGFNLATALEVSLKLKETSRVFAEGYSTADLEHGPIVLAAPDVPLLVVRPDGPMGLAIDDSIERAEAIGSRTWLIGGRELNGRADSLALGAAPEEALPEALTPLVYVLPGQLLAEAVALRLGRDPDAPSGLTKITRTR
jgi:glucosamine--fructose-6-phosphate aminotransferase (isomerizing)